VINISQAALAYKKQIIFENINLFLNAGEWIALLGPSGVGKTSLLRMIAGLNSQDEITSGTVQANNGMPVHQQIAYMAQTDLLLPWLTVLDNILLGFKLRHEKQLLADKINQAKILLKKVGLADAVNLYPKQLSGGMRQRAALIRTLIEDKPIILMDEPFSAVDAITRYKLQDLSAELLKTKTVLFVTHDPLEALRLANKIYVMKKQDNLQLVADLKSPAPRSIANDEVMTLQNELYQQLKHAALDFL
jgi:putative hydroxymethylpyrimidine transport system ATP-binding protein